MDLERIYQYFLKSKGVSIDSRKILPGQMFFALSGKNVNASQFAQSALEKGASYVIVDQESPVQDKRIIRLDNSLEALQQLATYHRQHLDIPVFALTGSNGKTTTKELIAAVLANKYQVAYTHGNLNNHIGVPLSLLNMPQDAEIAVIEMGANHVGEIAFLCKVAKPTHGLITNIGKAHIGEFGGFENIIRGKSELFDYLRKSKGQVFINRLDPVLSNMEKRFLDAITYGDQESSYPAQLIKGHAMLTLQDKHGQIIKTQLAGDYNFSNAVAALTVGDYFGVKAEQSAEAIRKYAPENMRSQVVEKNGVKILLDAYNANPTSLHAALDYLATFGKQPKAVVLGDMYELGSDTESEHRAVGERLQKMDIQQIYLLGEYMQHAQKACPKAKWYASFEELKANWTWEALKDHMLLVKGSRSMALERLVSD